MNCRYCSKLITDNPVKTLAYWNQTPDVCHQECKQTGERQEAFDCQCIDSDCNDCKHYQRGHLAAKVISNLEKEGRVVEVAFQPNEIVGGRCLKLNKPTTAYPHTFTGRPCFEHRRSLQ